ncbi:hypothetical protein [Methanoculleus bourgensis]|jgi:hypothetical protein|uniref:Uncharacterized protein n=1 Tax=Methanoculleus bourgensis TaxID=83986 RepID=A0A0X3BP60_9EURY|nr:hypothetical protein [Methanoculleus bourgensis]CVK33942.1 protein of unknown function [Methanoculleus bourgensis]
MQIASTPDGTVFIEGKVVTALDRSVAPVTGIIDRSTGCVIVSGVRCNPSGKGKGHGRRRSPHGAPARSGGAVWN